jgi:hypothetical protein
MVRRKHGRQNAECSTLTMLQCTHCYYRNFFTKIGATVIQQPPYLPDLALADFFLFSKLKSTLKGQRCGTREEVKGKWPEGDIITSIQGLL